MGGAKINTPAVETAILLAAGQLLGRADLWAHYQGGCWWVHAEDGACWKVVDAPPFRFELFQKGGE